MLDPLVNVDQLKSIGSLWGSWQTWRSCQTDNVVCHNTDKAQQLIGQNFHTLCNFYIPHALYLTLETPKNIQVYQGKFAHDIEHHDELVAMHLAATTNDIVLLLGFNWPEATETLTTQERDYRGLIYYAIKDNPKVQWVMIDAPNPVRSDLTNLGNFSTDSLSNVIKLMIA
jgi:hypothetical protein